MYNDFEKKDIEFFWETVNPDFHMQMSFSPCILLCSRFPFDTWTSPIIHLLCPPPPPPILRSLCFQLSWVLQSSQGKLKTLLMQNWRGKQRVLREMCKWRIMLFDLPEPYSCCLLQIACPHYPGKQYIQVTSAADT